jgi:hypothetical protein
VRFFPLVCVLRFYFLVLLAFFLPTAFCVFSFPVHSFPYQCVILLTCAFFPAQCVFLFLCVFSLFQCVLRFFLLQNILSLTTALFSLLVRFFFHFPVRFSPFQCVLSCPMRFFPFRCVLRFFSFPVPFAFFFLSSAFCVFLLHRSVSLLSVASTIKTFSTITHSLLK